MPMHLSVTGSFVAHGMVEHGWNEAAVRYIRRARASGATYKELGKRFGCHLSSIHYAAKLGWQHVTHEAG